MCSMTSNECEMKIKFRPSQCVTTADEVLAFTHCLNNTQIFFESIRMHEALLRTERRARKGLNGVTSNPFNRQVPRQSSPALTADL